MSVGVRVGGPARRPAPTGRVAPESGAPERNVPQSGASARNAPQSGAPERNPPEREAREREAREREAREREALEREAPEREARERAALEREAREREAREREARERVAPERAALEREICALADELTRATRRQKQALAEKDRLSRLLDVVLDNLDAAVVLAAPDGRALAANAAARQLGAEAGRPLPELLAAGDAAVAAGDAAAAAGPATVPAAAAAAAGHAAVPTAASAVPRRPDGPSGRSFVVRARAVTLPGGASGRLVLAHDVTRLVRLEEQARRQSNLEALGRMAAELAHEVRNPLGSLELFASMLATDLADRPDAQELAEQVLLGVRQLSATVTRILATVRGGAPRRVALDAAALAREAASFVAPVAAARGIELEAPEGSEMLPARLDREGVLQALLNLLGNALEAAPAGGRARIAAWRRDEEVGFDVDDSGPGVPDALRARVLEPFFTTRAEGTGLGLAVVERVAIGHGGALEVTRGPLGGARFRLIVRDDAGDPA